MSKCPYCGEVIADGSASDKSKPKPEATETVSKRQTETKPGHPTGSVREAERKRTNQWRANNRDRYNQTMKEWRENNREEYKAYMREYMRRYRKG